MTSAREMTLHDAAALAAGARIERGAGGGNASNGDGALVIRGLAFDSRIVQPGDLFFAVPGFKVDGSEFVAEAVARGAVAVVAEGPVATPVPRLRVSNVRDAMGRIAARFFGDPSRELLGIGATGTNGKTTTIAICAAILAAAARAPGVMGTLTYRVGTREEKAPRTTPEAIDLHRMLRGMVDAGNASFAMEISSHAIALGRVTGLALEAMIFTNMSRDHLDFHGTMEAYYETKRRFFRRADLAALNASVTRAVINIDDAYGQRLARETDLPLTTFGRARDATVRVEAIEETLSGSRLRVAAPRGGFEFWLPLPGRFHQENALAAIAAAEALELPRSAVVSALETVATVPGRFQLIESTLGISVIVDYAHSPDGLSSLLRAVRPLAPRRVITLFGCGGDRDRGKRPLMGAAAGEGSDFVVLTSDNPRNEEPGAIIAEAEAGLLPTGTAYVVCEDRRRAIATALDEAAPGDTVILAGKGHEEYQEIRGVRTPFQDAEIVTALLREREALARERAAREERNHQRGDRRS
ncbi:MAG: UDP-N-acetylmuramoyl-L-alanyl-D-glutamate--2,6-diaminopimelate ligase [bacterium]